MLATSRAWFLFAFSFLLFGGSAWAQISAIEGDVKDPDGQPLKGVSILIERKDMKGTYKGAKTDKKGHYIYNGLPLGLYKVSVLIDNQVRDTVDNVKTQLGEPKVVDFDLKKTAQQAQDLQKAAETGTLTKEQERGLTKEQKDALEKRAKESAAAMAHNKALNEAFNAGKEAFLAKNYQLAVDSFSKAAEVDPKQSVVWGNLADAYVALAGTQTGADQLATCEKSLADPNYADAQYQYGVYLISKSHHRFGWQDHPAAGHQGSLPEIPRAGANRSQLRGRQGNACLP
jgi:tetratricopeptide (TPR) repeat protein